MCLIPMPEGRWHTITMDFVMGLPLTPRGHDVILTVVDKFSKRVRLTPVKKTITARQTATTIEYEIIRIHGFIRRIISDRDPRFLSTAWDTMLKRMGITHHKSTAYHPQTDGQSEVANKVIEQMLRTFINQHQTDWDDWLPCLEYAYNCSKNATTGIPPFELDLGRKITCPTNFMQYKADDGSAHSLDTLVE